MNALYRRSAFALGYLDYHVVLLLYFDQRGLSEAAGSYNCPSAVKERALQGGPLISLGSLEGAVVVEVTIETAPRLRNRQADLLPFPVPLKYFKLPLVDKEAADSAFQG